MVGIQREDTIGSTRRRILAFLQRGERTVEEIAKAIGLSENGIRNQLALLEGAGLVRRTGKRPGRRRPSFLFGVTEESDRAASRAYAPVLIELIAVLAERLDPGVLTDAVATVGRRIGSRRAPDTGTLQERLDEAQSFVAQLGGVSDLSRVGNRYRIQGHGCPLGLAVAKHPQICEAVRVLLSEVVGIPMVQRCVHTPRPRCCFETGPIPRVPGGS